MARAYTVATVALALDVESKWLDNVLTHYKVPGVLQHRQGVSRRLSSEAVFLLRIALSLSEHMGVPIGRSIDLAKNLHDGQGSYMSAGGLALSVDFAAFQTLVQDRLAAAVEVAPLPRRGRPPQSKTGRLE